jgi:hypothetical protein
MFPRDHHETSFDLLTKSPFHAALPGQTLRDPGVHAETWTLTYKGLDAQCLESLPEIFNHS